MASTIPSLKYRGNENIFKNTAGFIFSTIFKIRDLKNLRTVQTIYSGTAWVRNIFR
jgi:hypothetical protein